VSGELVSFPLELAAGTKLARIHLDSAEHQHDLDLVVFDGSCEVVSWDTCDALWVAANIGPDEKIELMPSEATSYFVAFDPYVVAGADAPYTLDWWVVADGPSNLTVSAPSEVSAGTSVDVQVSWPPLASGEWLGVVEYTNEHGPLRETVLDVTIP